MRPTKTLFVLPQVLASLFIVLLTCFTLFLISSDVSAKDALFASFESPLKSVVNSTDSSRHSEFQTYSNGLIYSQSTIRQLRHIVDSLNLKHKVCDLHKSYRSIPQGRGHYFSLSRRNLDGVLEDLEDNISFKDFIERYPQTISKKDLIIIKFSSENDEGEQETTFRSIAISDYDEYSISLNSTNTFHNGRWIYVRDEEEIRGFYLEEVLKAPLLPKRYAKLVQYVDCLVDTTAQVFIETDRGRLGLEHETPKEVEDLLQYVHTKTGKPVYQEEDTTYYERYHKWYTTTRIEKVKNDLAKTKEFMVLLRSALPIAMLKGGYDVEFEEYVGLFLSKKSALELKRKRRVIGGCSMDLAPREHALAIAQLSAETVNWEIFLRAHLDVMNDRFDRVSDGSYAWARRMTYIKELEVLDINVPSLLLGSSLRIDNAGPNHYYGSIGRLGRAMSESQQIDQLENMILRMIQDKQLDTYNKVLLYYLFRNYNYHLEDTNRQHINFQRLNKAVQALPSYLASTAVVKE